MPAGRPSSYTDAIADEIVERISAGESLTDICESDRERFPNRTTVLRWLAGHKEFAAKYERARELAGDAEFDKHRAVMADLAEQKIEPDAARVLLNAIQWRAKVLSPRYQDRTNVNHSGAVAVPVTIQNA